MDLKMETGVSEVNNDAKTKGMMFGGVTFLVGSLIGYAMLMMSAASSWKQK